MKTSWCLLVVLTLLPSIYGHENPSIVVIGAGPAGIAAATRLWKHNFTNLKVLEAGNRIGGRVNSVKFGDAYLDLGAQWCHGEKDNIVYNTVKEYNILKPMESRFAMVYSNGSYLSEEFYENLEEFAESIDASVPGPGEEDICEGVRSIGECFDKRFNTTFQQKYKNDPEKLRIALESAQWLQNYIVGYDSPPSLYDLSPESDYRRCQGHLTLTWNGLGFKTVLEVMLQKYPDPNQQLPVASNIILNKEVTRIYWDTGSSKHQVETADNSSYRADIVIFTPSLGVLKARHEELFQPQLPEEKVTAIRGIGFGAIMKIILHFPQTWWDTKKAYAFVWSPRDSSRILTEFGKGPIKNGRSWLTTSIVFFTPANNPKVLLGFFSGELIPEMEQTPNEVLTEGCMYMFKKFLGEKFAVVDPDDMIKSTWYSNPFFRGTYSYESVKGNSSGKKLPDKLGAPLYRADGNLGVLFAGEATHPYYFSTVHGAIETGYREANRIIEYYGKSF